MKKHFAFVFVLLLTLGFGGSVALAQVDDVATESPDPLIMETATPTPTETPTEVPELIVAVEEENTVSPVWVFLAGALIGAALLALAEVSGVSYVKKHGKGPKQ